ncbi:MAG: GHKL domain-containing protein [Lactobacillus sp.]|uniref:sensor histidine kinase n=1 Tax=Lactobacillus sp. TaxID=1591 RepID=UPI0023CDDD64|nr:GHKL domain-containing protein [Lactobacillus sp.]MDE7050325.1 GHKL domain-containing protein [Lactobacillus sp.]
MIFFYLLAILLSIVLDLFLFYKVTKLKVSKAYFLFYLLLVIIGVICSFYGYKTILFYNVLAIVILNIIHRENNNLTLISGTLIYIFGVDLIIELLRGIFLDVIEKFNMSKPEIEWINLGCIFCLFLITYLIIFFSANWIRKRLTGNNYRIFFWLILYLYLVTLVIAVVYEGTKNIPPATIFFLSFLIVQFIFSIGLYYLMIKNQKVLLKKSQQDKLIKEQKQLQDYAQYLEESEDELRAFRHDYRNMFNSLKISAQEGNTKEVIQKLDEYTKANLNAKAFEKYRDVNHIKIKSLKSIIIAKLTEMYGEDIPYNFECSDEITRLPKNINEIDLVRIIGISCDNAIEESKALLERDKEAHIEIMINSNDNGEFEYEIQNKRRESKISLKQIQQRGYSTKKSHSGVGLANINNIKNKYENMTISYEVPKGYFDFYLVIEPEE